MSSGAHYFVSSQFDFAHYEGFVIDGSAMTEINDLYIISDVLVTDYSSVFFDYANLVRPIVFYMYDLDRYANELRGFYLELDELPGPIVQHRRGARGRRCPPRAWPTPSGKQARMRVKRSGSRMMTTAERPSA